jgi:hypothetical protein
MQWMWCWRCKAEMPMLDEDEFAIISRLNREAIQWTKQYREENRATLAEASLHDRFRPVREAYTQITGMENCHENAIMHHRISRYGPPCRFCQKPLRTPEAKLCGSCMQPVVND